MVLFLTAVSVLAVIAGIVKWGTAPAGSLMFWLAAYLLLHIARFELRNVVRLIEERSREDEPRV